MSMWTLLQRRMDQGMAVSDAQARPAAQSTVPVPRDDPGGQTRRVGLQKDDPGRQSDGPGLRWEEPGGWRTRESLLSHVLQSQGLPSVDSPTRDPSPVNFSVALDLEDKIKERSISDEEDEDGNHKKISAAQYQLFRQAVTTSKGSFKVNPAKTRRASLLDLGDSEVTDRVSWLDQPSLQDTMASTARIAQGLKEDEEVEKTTLSETLNTASLTFKHLTVKQIFPREPYHLKVHRDAQYVPKPPGDNGFSDSKVLSSYQMSHGMCLDTEELARRSAIYASLTDFMVASVIEELSPKDERTKLLREKLAIIQQALVSAVSAGFAAASNLQLIHRDALLKNFGFQPQVLSTVRTARFEGSHVLGREPKVLQNRVRTIRQADRMAGSSVTFTQKQRQVKSSTKVTSSRKMASRTSVFDRLGSPSTTTERTVTQEPPFRAGSGRGARHRPYSDTRKKSGKASASSKTRQYWRVPGGGSPGGLCPALAESAGQLPGHRHCWAQGGHVIPATASAHPSMHQLPDQKQPSGPPASRWCLADEGSHRAGPQRDVPRILQPVVPGTQEDTLQDGDARVRPFSHQKSGVDGIDRHTRCLPSCADASGRPQVSTLRGQQETEPVHWSSIWAGDFPTRVHQAAATRRHAVKAARCEATRLLGPPGDQSTYSGTGQTARPDNHQGAPVSQLDHQLREVRPHTKSRLPVHQDAVQHSTIHSGAPAEDAAKGPVRSSAPDDWPEHHGQRSAQTSRHVGVHGFAGTTGKTSSSSGPVVGRHIMVPEDRELVRPDPSSSVGSVRGGLVGISSIPARSTPRHQGDRSDSLHGCVQFGLGSPVRLMLDTGTVFSISTIMAHQRSGDAGCHQRGERLPASSKVPGDSLDVRQRNDCGLHQERGGHEIAHFDAADHTTVEVVRPQGDYVGSRPSARSAQHPGRFPVQSRPDTDHGVDDGHGASTTRVCQVGRATDRLVCDIHQQTTHQVRIAVSGPRAEWTDAMSMPWDNGRGLMYVFPPFKMVPQVLQIAQSPGVKVILITQLQPAASWFPELMDLSQEDPIPLYVEGQDLLTQDVWTGDGVTKTRHFRRSNPHAILRVKGHSREAANMMSRCLRESSLQVYESHWSRFVAFCRTKTWHVFRVRSHHFSTYMMHLFRDGLLPSTMISHRTSVASVLCHWVYDPAAGTHWNSTRNILPTYWKMCILCKLSISLDCQHCEKQSQIIGLNITKTSKSSRDVSCDRMSCHIMLHFHEI